MQAPALVDPEQRWLGLLLALQALHWACTEATLPAPAPAPLPLFQQAPAPVDPEQFEAMVEGMVRELCSCCWDGQPDGGRSRKRCRVVAAGRVEGALQQSPPPPTTTTTTPHTLAWLPQLIM